MNFIRFALPIVVRKAFSGTKLQFPARAELVKEIHQLGYDKQDRRAI